MLPEPIADGSRIVLWLPGDRDASFQYWERVANVARGEITVEQGLCATGGDLDSSPAKGRGPLGQLWNRLRRIERRNARFPASQRRVRGTMRRQTERPDPGLVRREWRASSTRLESSHAGPRQGDSKSWGRTFSWSLDSNRKPAAGNRAGAGRRHRRQPTSPRGHAEAILAAARQTGARDKEATALTDLGVIHLNEGDPTGAIASLRTGAGDRSRARRHRPGKRRPWQSGHGHAGGSPARACPRAVRARARARPRRPAIGSPRRSRWNAWGSPPGTCATSTAPSAL